jgi:outer membrane immunogenic protein
MNRGWLAAVAFLVHPALAVAQDAAFEGFYVGGSAGGAFGSASLQATTADSVQFDNVAGTYFQASSVPVVNAAGLQRAEPRGVPAAVQAGYNWRRARVVLGVEADIGSMRFEHAVSASDTYPCCEWPPFTVAQFIDTSWIMTARPRIGYARGGWLVYGTAGLALTRLQYQGTFADFTIGPTTESASVDEGRPGWSAGGGVEYALGRWSVAALYLRTDFGSATTVSRNLTSNFGGTIITFPNAPFTHTASLRADLLRVGINYGF